ncbi:NAD(P)-dependent glycerol-3-phosphate dehydrogenase [bacterium AH-315-L15]|nr:NAD(P)-dependent glycerol-3-phosphate dehydrogenase [bacterium AH-315-L15]
MQPVVISGGKVKIAVIGGGSWGTTLAQLLAKNGHRISLWIYEKELSLLINEKRENAIYLPGVRLSKTIFASSNMEDVLSGANWVLFAAPSHVARTVLTTMQPYLSADTIIISATKGIERKSLMLIADIICETLGRKRDDGIAILSGPSFAAEVVKEYPTAVSLATKDSRLGARIQKAFTTHSFKLFLSLDLMGVQLGGALKNIIAIAAGGSDGLGFGFNTKAILIAQGLSEMVRLGVAMGADTNTFYGQSGMGDLFLTCSGAHSRNRWVGELIGAGKSLKDIQQSMQTVAEGIYTTESAYALSQKYHVEMPIVQEVYRVLFEAKPARQAVLDLMEMARGEE